MDKTRYFLPLPPSFIEAYLTKTQANTQFFLLIYNADGLTYNILQLMVILNSDVIFHVLLLQKTSDSMPWNSTVSCGIGLYK